MVDRHRFDFCVAVENDLFLESGSKVRTFLCPGHRNRLGVRVGIKIDLISVLDSKLNCSLCAGSNLTWF